MPPTKANGRFQLPQIKPMNFSLTDGTDIPPPLASPVEERPPPPISKSADAQNTAPKLNGSATTTPTNGVNGATHENEPLSPASSKRPGGIRRFLSKKSLNANYISGANANSSREDLARIGRPESSMSFTPSHVGKKRSVSWFRRLGSGMRTSMVIDEKISIQPPPPKLPELTQLKANIPNDEGSLGGEDLFKNIN